MIDTVDGVREVAVSELLEFKSQHGGSLLLEVEDHRGPVTDRGRPADSIVEASQSLKHVLARLGPVVQGIVSQLRTTITWPDPIEVEFSAKPPADSNVIIARTGEEANFRIAPRWFRERR
jgi:Trypsin-co-occurring domain 1